MDFPGLEIKYLGYPIYFCDSKNCLFRLSTAIIYENKIVLVGTVGAWYPTNEKVMMINCDGYFETKCWYGKYRNKMYTIDDISNEIYLDAPFYVSELDYEKAEEMHQKNIDEIIDKLYYKKEL
jgi:hypothetical protein